MPIFHPHEAGYAATAWRVAETVRATFTPATEPVWAYLTGGELGLGHGTRVVKRVSGEFSGVGDGWSPPDSFHFTDDGRFVFAVSSGFGTGRAPRLLAIEVDSLVSREIV